jgi:twinkle protein
MTDFAPENQSLTGLIPQDQITFGDLTKRHVSLETCKQYAYGIAEWQGTKWQVAQYRDETGRVVLQKLRGSDKSFRWLSSGPEADKYKRLFGQDLHKAGDQGSSKFASRIIVTEGELDCLAARQAVGTWAVVSLPDGASSARKYLQRSLEWLMTFDEIVLAFDMDDAGQKAVEEVIDLFPARKVRIAKLSGKDASDVLISKGTKGLRDQLWAAPKYTPDWAVQGEQILDEIRLGAVEPGIPYPWAGLDEALAGIRPKQLTLLAAGTSSGKSSVCRHLALHCAQQGKKVGYVALEESVRESALGIYGIAMKRHLTLLQEEEMPWEDLEGVQKDVGENLVFTKAWGSQDVDELIGRLRFLAKGCDCKVLFLDHLSIAVSGLGDENERLLLDKLMTALRTFVEETGVALFVVSHLSRTPGQKSAEEGGRVSSSHLRGSHGIAQLSDTIIAVERNQQAEDEEERCTSTLRILKNRALGTLGPMAWLKFDPDTHVLNEIPKPAEDNIASDFS